MSKSLVWRALALFALPLCFVWLAGCGSSNSGPKARVRVVNTLTGTPSSVDVRAGNQVITTSAPFNTITPGNAVEVDASASTTVNVFAPGTTTTIASLSNATFQPNADNLILVAGVGGASGVLAPKALVLGPIDLSSTPTSSQARVYFINAAPEATTATFSYPVTGQAPTSVNVALNALSAPQLPVIAASPNNVITVTATVTPTGGSAETVGPTTLTLSGGKTYAVVLTGRLAASGTTPGLALQIFQL
jgi:hypothetical protein